MHAIRMLSAAGVALCLGLAGCGGEPAADDGVASAGGAATATPSAPPVPDEDRPIRFSQCMREHGMAWFPDPAGGGLQIRIPKGQDKGAFDAAMEACKQWSPMGGDGPDKVDPRMVEQMRQLSRCMRENGVPKFPDPQPDGRMQIDGAKLGIDPDDPAFQAADQACSRFKPSGPPPVKSR